MEEGVMDDVRYPKIVVQLALEGLGGNAYAVMGKVAKAMKRAGVPREEVEAYYAESTGGSYEDLLAMAERWVTVK